MKKKKEEEKRREEDYICVYMFGHNKELFESAPPYMITSPYLKGGLYMSARQKSKFIFKLTCIRVLSGNNSAF